MMVIYPKIGQYLIYYRNIHLNLFNPDIANTLFRSGYIESWGRGIEKMMNYCKDANIPVPHYSFEGSDFLVEFRKDIYHEEYLTI